MILSYGLRNQEYIDGIFWCKINDENLLPDENGQTKSTNFNDILSYNGVYDFKQAFPFAKTNELQKIYEIKCDNNKTESLIFSLKNNFPSSVTKFIRHTVSEIELYDPSDYFWQSHQDWLWHLTKIQADSAWEITRGDTNIIIAILDTDFDIDHPDLETEIILPYDPYTMESYDCSPFNSHGTTVASFASAETSETGIPANGSLPSIGFNTKIIAYKAWVSRQMYLQKALHASSVMNADVLTSSAGGWGSCPDTTGIEELAVKEILNNGTVIVMPAGNGINGTHNFCPEIDSVYHTAFFPLSPYYDSRIILVTSTDENDNHTYFVDTVDHTHSHFPSVDICSPGYCIFGAKPTNCGSVTWPYYGCCTGTSHATPIVAGICGLIKSINKCLLPEEIEYILKSTTDPILDANLYQGLIGTGRVNAYKAVKKANNYYSNYTISSSTVWAC